MKSLFNVLRVYSLFDPELGYCQGMSGITGTHTPPMCSALNSSLTFGAYRT